MTATVTVDSLLVEMLSEDLLESINNEVDLKEALFRAELSKTDDGKFCFEATGQLQVELSKRKFVWLMLGSIVILSTLSQWIMTILPELINRVYFVANTLYTLIAI